MAAACRLVLTNDSGAMHIASALGVPTVTVFGATDHTTTGPTGPLARVVREQVECSPCLKRECPIDHRCMTRVTVDRVMKIAAPGLAMVDTRNKILAPQAAIAMARAWRAEGRRLAVIAGHFDVLLADHLPATAGGAERHRSPRSCGGFGTPRESGSAGARARRNGGRAGAW